MSNWTARKTGKTLDMALVDIPMVGKEFMDCLTSHLKKNALKEDEVKVCKKLLDYIESDGIVTYSSLMLYGISQFDLKVMYSAIDLEMELDSINRDLILNILSRAYMTLAM